MVARKNRASCARRPGRSRCHRGRAVRGAECGRRRRARRRRARSRRRLSSQDESHVRSGLQSLRADLGGREALLAGAASGGERPARERACGGAEGRRGENTPPLPPTPTSERASESEREKAHMLFSPPSCNESLCKTNRRGVERRDAAPARAGTRSGRRRSTS